MELGFLGKRKKATKLPSAPPIPPPQPRGIPKEVIVVAGVLFTGMLAFAIFKAFSSGAKGPAAPSGKPLKLPIPSTVAGRSL